MDSIPLYQQVAQSVRKDILSGTLKPGDRLPSIRDMTEKWGCTTGTIQRAYHELAQQGLVVSKVGQGTHVIDQLPTFSHPNMRKALLYNRVENFLLETITAGYSPEEVEQTTRMAADRWRVLEQEPAQSQIDVLRFVGSHDMAITLVAAQFQEINPRFSIQLTFSGSLNGLIALAEKNADLAGCHLWDEESDTYNTAFVRRILPGQSIALLTLAHRNVGLIVGFDNPKDICSLSDLVRSGVQFVNRQMGSGTRVWLDAHLRKLGISGEQIQGYGQEKMTHTEVAAAVMKTEADAGLGVQTAALALGLEFIPLTTERYDLAIPEGKWQSPAIQVLARWLKTAQAKAAIANLGGYGVAETGRIEWVQ